MFSIVYETQTFIPPRYVVTLLTEHDGWETGPELPGDFANVKWTFPVDLNTYGAAFTFKFYLDHSIWSLGKNNMLALAEGGSETYTDDDVHFEGVPGSDPRVPVRPGALARFEAGTRGAIISYDIPGPKSYRGKHIVQLPYSVSDFVVPTYFPPPSTSPPSSHAEAATLQAATAAVKTPPDTAPELAALVLPRGAVIQLPAQPGADDALIQLLTPHECTDRLISLSWGHLRAVARANPPQRIVVYLNIANQFDYRVRIMAGGGGPAPAVAKTVAAALLTSDIRPFQLPSRPAPDGGGGGGGPTGPSINVWITTPPHQTSQLDGAPFELTIMGTAYSDNTGPITVYVWTDDGQATQTRPDDSDKWSALLLINPGQRRISAKAEAQASGKTISSSDSLLVTVTPVDNPPPVPPKLPAVAISSPIDGTPIVAPDETATLTVAGTADSNGQPGLQVTVTAVGSGLKPVTPPLTPDPTNANQATWTADLLLTGLGSYSIVASCQTRAGAGVDVSVQVSLLKATPIRALHRRIFLVETIALSSFLGDYGVGRLLKTFSVNPGEEVKITTQSYTKDDATRKSASSIVDSNASECASDFEDTLSDEQDRKVETSTTQSRELSASLSAHWGPIGAEVKGKISEGTNSNRQEAVKDVHNAVAKHSMKASANRTVSVSSEWTQTTAVGNQEDVTRSFKNINVSRVLNFVFTQMSQQHVVVTHLVDARIGLYSEDALLNTSGVPIQDQHGNVVTQELYQEYSLPEFDQLADSLFMPNLVQTVRDHLRVLLKAIPKWDGNMAPLIEDFTPTSSGPDPVPTYLRVIPRLVDTIETTSGRKFSVPGIALGYEELSMATDGVLVDSVLALGDALDDYSAGLQGLVVNERQALLDQKKLALQIVAGKDAAAADIYQKVFPPQPAIAPPSSVASQVRS